MSYVIGHKIYHYMDLPLFVSSQFCMTNIIPIIKAETYSIVITLIFDHIDAFEY